MTTLMVGTVLTVLSGAYFASSLSQSNIARRQFEANQEFYSAESGIAYGYVEALSGGTLTHKIINSITGELEGELKGDRQFSADVVDIDGSGNMVIKNKAGRVIAKGKIYEKGSDTIILVQAVNADGEETGPIHRYVISHKSLYKYFEFYDTGTCNAAGNWKCYEWSLGWSGTHKGKLVANASTSPETYFAVGKVHVNGNILLNVEDFESLPELSCSGQFLYGNKTQFSEPALWDNITWNNTNKSRTYNYNQSNCANCMLDGLAPLNRYEYSPYNFVYPLEYDNLTVTASPISERSGTARDWAHEPGVHIYGYQVTDDWPDITTYGNTHFWMDIDKSGVLTSSERQYIPKILPSCSGCGYDWDKYSGNLNDNYASWLRFGSGSTTCSDSQAVRFEVTNSSYQYEALRWLADKESAANPNISSSSPSEYSSATTANWLTTAATTASSVSANSRWDSYEYDRVTLLSILNEGNAASGLNPNQGSGLKDQSEYGLYVIVKYYLANGSFPSGTDAVIQNWVTDSGRLPAFDGVSGLSLNDFFAWWKQRRHHHGFDLSDCSSASYDGNWCFSNDKTAQTTDGYGRAVPAVPAWERIFWEAWLNYWPPVRGKNHNQVYSPADNRHAINPEWWEDLVYGNDRPVSGTTDTVLSLTHLNTYNEPQAGVFSAWLKDRGLLDESNNYAGSIIKFDAPISGYHGHADCPGHGGEILEPLSIKEAYKPLAQKAGGLFIEQTAADEFTVYYNGANVADGASLSACLSALNAAGGGAAWISAQEFYNPYTITKGVYDPALRNQDETNSSKTAVYINPCDVYSTLAYPYIVDNSASSCSSSTAIPPTVKAIQIDISLMPFIGDSDDDHVIYIDAPGYDVRLKNGAKLPNNFTLASPYDVYVQAQKKSESEMSSLSGVNINFDGDATVNEADVYRGVFNYEIGDKTRTDQGLDANFKPAAVITNSRVYFLSSEFLDRNTVFPFSYQYPANPYSVKNDYFLETYCDPVWPTSCGGVSGFPAEPDPVTWSWVRTNLTDQQQGCLLAAGESRYQSVHAADMVNTVGFGQLFNLAVASPFEPWGYRLERWGGSSSPLFLEGAFLKIGFWRNEDLSYKYTRYHTRPDTVVNWYERARESITSGHEYMADDLKVANNSVSSSVTYEYEERFWMPGGQPSGDFLASGYEQRWDQLSGTDENFDYDTLPEL
mgnify:CR=1 FL=1